MTILKIPIDQKGSYFRFGIELDGVGYTLGLRWNERVEQWVLDFADGEGVVLIAGLRCVVNVPLLERNRGAAGLPPGWLIFVDSSGADLDMAYGDLGRRVELFYVPRADYQARLVELGVA